MSLTLIEAAKTKAKSQQTAYESEVVKALIESASMSLGDMIEYSMMMQGKRERELEAKRIEEELETHITTTCEKCGHPATLIISDTANAFTEAVPYRINHNGKSWTMTLAEIRSKGFDQGTGNFDEVLKRICKFEHSADTEALAAYFK